ncbi:hypothetical protein GCM10028808_12090 [Spirosoma migulaei]
MMTGYLPVRDFKVNLSSIICYLGIILLFTPKVNLISFADQSAGIRIDDIIISCIAGTTFLLFSTIYKKKFSPLELLFYIFVFLGIFSNIINIVFNGQSNLLYSFRNVEYFVFFYIGYFSRTKITITKVSYIYILINGFVIFLQKFALIGGFRSEGYFDNVSTRPVGLTGGPWEVGTILMFALCVIIYVEVNINKKILFSILVLILLLITGARLPTLSYFIVIGALLFSKSKNKLFLILCVFFIVPLLLVFISQFNNPVIQRSANLFSYSNIDQFLHYYKSIKVESRFIDFPETPFDETSDMSWLYRISKWSFAIKYWLNSGVEYIIGLGPGIWGFALDGGWIRILTENGILASVVYIMFLMKVSAMHSALKMIVITLAINMIMIDIHMAYKCMAFFFFAIGYFSDDNKFTYSFKIT